MNKVWPKVALGELLRRSDEIAPIEPDKDYREITVKLWGKGVVLRGEVLGVSIAAARRFVARKGQFILSRIDARNGALGLVPGELDGAIVTNDFPLFSVNSERLLPEFLDWMSRTEGFVDLCRRASEGTTNRIRLQEDRFLELEIQLPPLAEQRRIVARIEVLINQINDAKALSQESRDGATALFPSLLSEMLLGSGVIANVTVKKSATALLHENAKRYAASMSKNNNAHPEQPVILFEGPKPLPKNWVWTTLGSVLSVLVDCVNDTPDFVQENTGLLGLKSTNIRPYKLDLSRKWFVTPEDFSSWNRRETPRPGDIVLTREAPMGLSCKLPEGVQACLTQRLMLLRADDRVVMPDLVLHYLNSSLFLQQVEEQCRGLTTPHIRVQDTPKFIFPLPPLEVQHDLVKKLEQLQGEIDSLKSVQRDVWEEMEATVPAILDRAFKGEL